VRSVSVIVVLLSRAQKSALIVREDADPIAPPALAAHLVPYAGITQIRSDGRWRDRPPSQPGCPKLPYGYAVVTAARRWAAAASYRQCSARGPAGQLPRPRAGNVL